MALARSSFGERILGAILSLTATGAGVWWVTSADTEAPREDWITWVASTQRELGTQQGGAAWRHMVRAAETWRPISQDMWRSHPAACETWILDALHDPKRSPDDPVVQHAVKCLEAARSQGVFDDAEAWLAGGAPVEPWDENETPSRGHHFKSVLSALQCMSHVDRMNGDDASRAKRFEIMLAMAVASSTETWQSGQVLGGEYDRETNQEIRCQLVAEPMSEALMQELLTLVTVDNNAPWHIYIKCEIHVRERAQSREHERFKSRGAYRAYQRERRVWSAEFVESAPSTIAETFSEFSDLPMRLLAQKWTAADGMDFWRWLCLGIRQSELMRQLERRGTACFLAIELFEAREGRLPDSLQEAARALKLPADYHIDPSAGAPFGYRREPSAPRGYVLYARGIDGEDNGGKFDLPYGYALAALRKGGEGFDYDLLAPRFIPPPPSERPPAQCGTGLLMQQRKPSSGRILLDALRRLER